MRMQHSIRPLLFFFSFFFSCRFRKTSLTRTHTQYQQPIIVLPCGERQVSHSEMRPECPGAPGCLKDHCCRICHGTGSSQRGGYCFLLLLLDALLADHMAHDRHLQLWRVGRDTNKYNKNNQEHKCIISPQSVFVSLDNEKI